MAVDQIFCKMLYLRDAVDLRSSDCIGNVADPGRAYGARPQVIGLLEQGNAITFFEGVLPSSWRCV